VFGLDGQFFDLFARLWLGKLGVGAVETHQEERRQEQRRCDDAEDDSAIGPKTISAMMSATTALTRNSDSVVASVQRP
jgi:hypothetical protein